MDRKNIDKIADNPEDRILLAKAWDKLTAGFQKNIPAHTGFLSPRQIHLVKLLIGSHQGLSATGGFPDAERKMYIFLPDYLTDEYINDKDYPIACLRASFYKNESLSHRDVLGALMGCGITRESVGDILISDYFFDFFISSEIAPYILENFQNAGRVSLKVERISLQDVAIPEQKYEKIRDTVASVRLDNIVSSGFRISRTAATEYILSGKAAIDGLTCEKQDKVISQGSKISVRGLGKIILSQIGYITKKGRISVEIHRYQ